MNVLKGAVSVFWVVIAGVAAGYTVAGIISNAPGREVGMSLGVCLLAGLTAVTCCVDWDD